LTPLTAVNIAPRMLISGLFSLGWSQVAALMQAAGHTGAL